MFVLLFIIELKSSKVGLIQWTPSFHLDAAGFHAISLNSLLFNFTGNQRGLLHNFLIARATFLCSDFSLNFHWNVSFNFSTPFFLAVHNTYLMYKIMYTKKKYAQHILLMHQNGTSLLLYQKTRLTSFFLSQYRIQALIT